MRLPSKDVVISPREILFIVHTGQGLAYDMIRTLKGQMAHIADIVDGQFRVQGKDVAGLPFGGLDSISKSKALILCIFKESFCQSRAGQIDPDTSAKR